MRQATQGSCASPNTPSLAEVYALLNDLVAITSQVVARCEDMSLQLQAKAPAPALPRSADTQRTVARLVTDRWPAGKPAGRRAMDWYTDIEAECRKAGITAGQRTIRRALGGR